MLDGSMVILTWTEVDVLGNGAMLVDIVGVLK